MIEQLSHKPLTAKRLVLSLLSAPGMDEVSVRELVRWAELFAIDAAALRVAIGRMVKAGLLRAPRRGVYRIGSGGEALRLAARSWRAAEARVVPWRGDWLVVHSEHLGRSNRSALRDRERALNLEGMRPLQSGLWIRPANYSEPMEATRQRMLGLGLEPGALVLRVRELSGAGLEDLERLWPREALERDYQAFTSAMVESAARLSALEIAEAARETFILGEAVIRLINADPLLPQQFVDVKARGELIAGMLTYDSLGQSVWERFRRVGDSAARDTNTKRRQKTA